MKVPVSKEDVLEFVPTLNRDDLLRVALEVKLALDRDGGDTSSVGSAMFSTLPGGQGPVTRSAEDMSRQSSMISGISLDATTQKSKAAGSALLSSAQHNATDVRDGNDPAFLSSSAPNSCKPTYIDLDAWEALDRPQGIVQPNLKRPGDDSVDVSNPKRMRIQGPTTLADADENFGLPAQAAEMQRVKPYEKGFPRIIEAVRLAHGLLVDIAPTTALEMAGLQSDWEGHGYSKTLPDALRLGEFHVQAMDKYFNSALELLAVLDDSSHWKLTGERIEPKCPYDKGKKLAPAQQVSEGIIPSTT